MGKVLLVDFERYVIPFMHLRKVLCSVLLLDEATSALDEATEAQVLDNLRNMKDITVLIVTHRPRACEICDRVIYMEDREGGNEL